MSQSPPPPPVDEGAGTSQTSPLTTSFRGPLHRNTSRSSTWSTDVPYHNQGTSYYPISPTPRRLPSRSVSAARSLATTSDRDEEAYDHSNEPSNAVRDERGKGPSTTENENLDAAGDAEEGEATAARLYTEDDPLTLKDRQSLMNVDHPFGLPIWKPALYKKSRTVNRNAETALHAIPSARGERHLHPGNIAWIILFGCWLAIACFIVSAILFIIPIGGRRYARLIFGLGWYLLWPFGKYVEGFSENAEGNVYSVQAAGESEHIIRAIDEEDEGEPTPRVQSPSSTFTRRDMLSALGQNPENSSEDSPFIRKGPTKSYGTVSSGKAPLLTPNKHRINEWLGKITFWLFLVCIIAPLMLCVCLVCWFLVITIPMAKLNWALIKLMFKRPDSIRFCAAPPSRIVPSPQVQSAAEGDTGGIDTSTPNNTYTVENTRLAAGQAAPSGSPSSTVLLCTYRAVGFQYYKYTIGGVNIFFVNLMAVVFFAIADGLIFLPLRLKYESSGSPVPTVLMVLTDRALIFIVSLASVIPLSYFIGMAVASISAQSSIGMGAVINATFGSIIEIILYAIALTQRRGRLVEGSIVGSLLAGVLLMPGVSMCSGAVRKKEQKFNAKSAGVTSTMLIMAFIGTLTPTLFYQTYGNLICDGCSPENSSKLPRICDHCYYEHPDPVNDPFYQSTVKSLMFFCAFVLLLSYLIGLWFSLRTHATQIWQNPQQLMHPLEFSVPSGQGRMSIYHRLLQTGLTSTLPTHRLNRKASDLTHPGDDVPSRSETPVPRDRQATTSNIHVHASSNPPSPVQIRRMSKALSGQAPSNQQQTALYTPFLESVNHAVKDSGLRPMPLPDNLTTDDFTRAVAVATVSALRHQQTFSNSPGRLRGSAVGTAEGHDDMGGHGGHEGPSWSRTTSASVLLVCTAMYAAIAEILVEVVDVVLEDSGIDEKFLGLTLFALVPNTTEFMNAMSFAMNGNIALSMEIGSAYALQVCLLQIPAMVAFSAWYDPQKMGTVADTFTLIFPRWDAIAIILSIFLMTYTYIEAKSNYHRGSILILSYAVLLAGFYFAPQRSDLEEGILKIEHYNPDSIKETIRLGLSSLWVQ